MDTTLAFLVLRALEVQRVDVMVLMTIRLRRPLMLVALTTSEYVQACLSEFRVQLWMLCLCVSEKQNSVQQRLMSLFVQVAACCLMGRRRDFVQGVQACFALCAATSAELVA